MFQYEHVEVSGTANVEVTETLLTGTTAEPKDVGGLLVTEVTGTLQGDAVLRVYKNTQRLMDLPIQHLLDNDGANSRPEQPYLPLDVTLEAGDELIVGQVSGATASDVDFGVRWQIAGGGGIR